jgi:hypothetical protein
MPDAICRFQPRRLSRWQDFLGLVVGNREWYRRLIGGHWERWWIDSPVNSFCWLPVDACSVPLEARPGLGRGTPECKDYP